MDYSTLSLVDLKQVAKTRHIKQYYIMKRSQLIQLLSMNELPQTFKIEKMTIHQLREEARRKAIRGFWTLRREDLVTLLFPDENDRKAPSYQNQQYQRNTNEHNHPQQHDAENIRV
jgi:hypothetical protein